MTLEEKLTALLKTICPRVKPDFAPVNTERPYITYQQIGGEAPDFLDGAVPTVENAEIQINVWADSRSAAKGLMMRIEVALIQATALQASPVSASVSDFDVDIPVYGSRQDFSVWSNR